MNIIGLAGEHWVISTLYRLGLSVVPTPTNYPGVDALVLYENGTFRSVQVKASADINRNMFLGKILREDRSHVYVLVYFGDNSGKRTAARHDRFRNPLVVPEVYIVPGTELRALTKSSGTVGWVLSDALLVASKARDNWEILTTPPAIATVGVSLDQTSLHARA